jgi:hypothetical protein
MSQARNEITIKAAVSVAEMARMVGLSRARFYELQRDGIFPPPLYSVSTRRPHYDEDGQRTCLEVKRRNCGVNGKPVLFYAARVPLTTRPPQPRPGGRRQAARASEHRELVEALKGLGLASVTAAEVETAVRACYPSGVGPTPHSELVRAIFLHLRRQNSADNAGR